MKPVNVNIFLNYCICLYIQILIIGRNYFFGKKQLGKKQPSHFNSFDYPKPYPPLLHGLQNSFLTLVLTELLWTAEPAAASGPTLMCMEEETL